MNRPKHENVDFFVGTEVVGTCPEKKGGWTHRSCQSVGKREESQKESSLSDQSLRIITVLSLVESGTEFTLVIKNKVLRVIYFLEKMRLGVVVVSYLLLLAIKSPTLFLSTSVVPD